jgi:hypothetical protein
VALNDLLKRGDLIKFFIMKSFILFSTALLALLLPVTAFTQSIAINTDGSIPNPSAILDVKSTTRGFLMPRMTTAQRNAIASPAEGLKVYDTDTKTFWFYNGTGWIQSAGGSSTNFWSQNGTHIFKNNGGNVGIGTINPEQLLTIQSPVNSYGITHTDNNIRLSTFVGGGAGGAWIGTQSNHPFHIYTNNGATPNVSFTTGFSSDFKGTTPRIQLFDGTLNSGTIKANQKNLTISAKLSNSLSAVLPGHLLLQMPAATDDLAGNVGIGEANPFSARLHIVGGLDYDDSGGGTEHAVRITGDNSFLDFTDYNFISYGFLRNRSDYTAGGFNHGFEIGVQPTAPGHPENYLSFSTNSFPRMVIAPNGNVGIGTNNPTYKLSVLGNIRSTEVVVETGWADYVFDKNYRLRSLDEVEKFIQQNKHLPNIPSAKEVEEKGLHLGDVQKRMMEKIEELTLYVIELKKEITSLKK